MSVASKSRAIRNIFLSLQFLLPLAAVLVFAHDQSLVAVAAALAFVLGLPCLLLSIADLGRALKIEHGGNYRATFATRLLSYYRATGGAICISVALYTLFRNIQTLINGTSAQPVMLQLLLVLGSLAWGLLGVLLTVRAFAKETGDPSST
jgi:hypothetical protein